MEAIAVGIHNMAALALHLTCKLQWRAVLYQDSCHLGDAICSSARTAWTSPHELHQTCVSTLMPAASLLVLM